MEIKLEIPIKYTGIFDAMYAKFTHFKALIWILCLNIMLLTDMQWKIMLELWPKSMDIYEIFHQNRFIDREYILWNYSCCLNFPCWFDQTTIVFIHSTIIWFILDQSLKWSANIYFRLRVHKIRIKNRQTFSLRKF